ncbi:MAG: hypothetical protein AAFQ65_09260 [Myxococcota bacterium]
MIAFGILICASNGLADKENQSSKEICKDAEALRHLGLFSEAKKKLANVLAKNPEVECALAGLTAAREAEVDALLGSTLELELLGETEPAAETVKKAAQV